MYVGCEKESYQRIGNCLSLFMELNLRYIFYFRINTNAINDTKLKCKLMFYFFTFSFKLPKCNLHKKYFNFYNELHYCKNS